MSMGEVIGLVNAGIAITLAVMAVTALRQGSPYWREWPPGFLIAVGGWLATLAVVLGQIAIFRWTTVEGAFGSHGWGTLGLRLLCLGFTVAMFRRLVTGELATDRDRSRLHGGGG